MITMIQLYLLNQNQILTINDQFRYSIQQRQEQLGKSGYRVTAMIQQKIKKSQYDAYKKSKQQSECLSNEVDLRGLPTDNYCFISNK